MFDFLLNENIDVWTYLKNSNKPIVMYGTGNGADKIFSVFDKYEIEVSDIFMSDDFYRTDATFHGFNLLKYEDIKNKYDDCIIVLCFAAFRRDLLTRIKEISNEYELRAPCVPVFGDDFFCMETLSKYENEIGEAYRLLSDDVSRHVFVSELNYRISGKVSYLFDCQTERNEVFENIIKLNQNETFVDLGAYRGDTVEEFLLAVKGKYKKIFALEPDIKNYNKLVENMGSLDNAEFINKASWSSKQVMHFSGGGGRNSNLLESQDSDDVIHTIDVDTVLNGEEATYIKMDVEGAEAETLKGLTKTLEIYRPKLIISAYHKTEDLFLLPLQLKELNNEYKIYLRHHPYIPNWETNYYCI